MKKWKRKPSLSSQQQMTPLVEAHGICKPKKPVELGHIDKICIRLSAEFGGLRKQTLPLGTPVSAIWPRLSKILRNHGMAAARGPVLSSYVEKGNVVEFAAMTQSFRVASPRLMDLVADIARHVTLAPKKIGPGALAVDVRLGLHPEIPVLVRKALFSYAGSEFTAVTRDGRSMVFEGGLQGQYNINGKMLLLDVLSGTLEALIHEVIHSKIHPEMVDGLDAPVGQLGQHVVALLTCHKPDTWGAWLDNLEAARMKALTVMVEFDNDLGAAIPNDWSFA